MRDTAGPPLLFLNPTRAEPQPDGCINASNALLLTCTYCIVM